LNDRYSPQQVAGELTLMFPDDPEMRVSHETIYQAVMRDARVIVPPLPMLHLMPADLPGHRRSRHAQLPRDRPDRMGQARGRGTHDGARRWRAAGADGCRGRGSRGSRAEPPPPASPTKSSSPQPTPSKGRCARTLNPPSDKCRIRQIGENDAYFVLAMGDRGVTLTELMAGVESACSFSVGVAKSMRSFVSAGNEPHYQQLLIQHHGARSPGRRDHRQQPTVRT
jgi:hypothetical protein